MFDLKKEKEYTLPNTLSHYRTLEIQINYDYMLYLRKYQNLDLQIKLYYIDDNNVEQIIENIIPLHNLEILNDICLPNISVTNITLQIYIINYSGIKYDIDIEQLKILLIKKGEMKSCYA